MPSARTSMSSWTRNPSLQPPPAFSLEPTARPEHRAPPRSAFSQRWVSPARQRRHSASPLWAQRRVGSTRPRSPSCAQRVEEARSTTPTTSCPGMNVPAAAYAVSTLGTGSRCTRARSVPQIPASAGRMSTQPGPGGTGVLTSRTSTGSEELGCARRRRPRPRRPEPGSRRVGSTTSARIGRAKWRNGREQARQWTLSSPRPVRITCAHPGGAALTMGLMTDQPPPPGPPPADLGASPPGWGPPPSGWGSPPPGWGSPPPGWGAPPGAWGPPPGSWGPQQPGWNPGFMPSQVGSGRFRSMSVGEWLDATFTLYRRNFALIASISAVVQIPYALLTWLLFTITGVDAFVRTPFASLGTPITRAQEQQLLNSYLGVLAVSIGLVLVSLLVVVPLGEAATTRAVSDRYLDRPSSLLAAYRAAWSRLGALIGMICILIGAYA